MFYHFWLSIVKVTMLLPQTQFKKKVFRINKFPYQPTYLSPTYLFSILQLTHICFCLTLVFFPHCLILNEKIIWKQFEDFFYPQNCLAFYYRQSTITFWKFPCYYLFSINFVIHSLIQWGPSFISILRLTIESNLDN